MPQPQNQGTPGRHIVLFGLFGMGNTGNDASLQVMLDALRKRLPGTRFTIVTRNPENVQAAPDVTCTPIRAEPVIHARWLGPVKALLNETSRWARAEGLLKTADCLLIPGTGMLDDFQAPTMGYAYPLWRWCRSAQFAGTPVMLVSIGAGPVERPWSRRFFSAVAKLAAHRSFRDEASRTFTRDVLKVDVSADDVTPDLAMAMEVDVPPPAAGEPQTIGVGVMNFHTWGDATGSGAGSVYEPYMEKLTAFCRDLLAQGKAIRILLGDTVDEPVADDLMARLGPQERVTVSKIATLQDMCAEIGRTDAVVATRFHTIVAAMLCGRPAVSIGYAKKNDAVMAKFGLAEFCQHIASFDSALLHKHFRAVCADATAIRKRQFEKRAGLRKAVETHLDQVAAKITGRQAG